MTEQSAEQPAVPPARPPLRRSSSDRLVAGVCGGLARTLDVDPILVRVIVAVLALLGGTGIAAYIIAWILIPAEDGTSVLQDSRGGRSRFMRFAIIIVLALATLSVFDSATNGRAAVGLIIAALVGVIVWQSFGDGDRWTWLQGDAASPGSVTVEQHAEGSTATLPTHAGTARLRKEPKSPLGRVVWNLLVILAGTGLALRWAGIVDVTPRIALAVALGIVAVGLLISAFIGRARGLIALGLVISLFAVPASWGGGQDLGTRTWTPVYVAAANSGYSYDLGVGDATVDLRSVVNAMPANSFVNITAGVGVGKLTVVLPIAHQAHVFAQSEVGLGTIQYPGASRRSGMNLNWNEEFANPMDAAYQRTVQLRLTVGMGDVVVRYA